MKTVPSGWQIPEAIRERFGQGSGRQRAMVHDGHLVLVLHTVPAVSGEREPAFFWRDPEGRWTCSVRGNGLPMLRAHVKAYADAEDRLQRTYRDADDAEDYFRILEALAPLQHAAQGMHAALQAAREGIRNDRDIIGLRDDAYEVERSLDLLYRDSKNAQDFSIARKAEEQARLGQQTVRAGMRLNVLAALFLPVTALASIFGMNLPNGLEQSPPLLFWTALGVGIAAGLGLCAWVVAGTEQ